MTPDDVTPDDGMKTATLAEHVSDLLGKCWAELDALLEEHLPEADRAEMGKTYPSAWVLAIGVSSIENTDAAHMPMRFAPEGQLPWTSIGLLEDTVAIWKGPVD